MTLYIGLMSGTSLDGVDGILAEFGDRALPSTLAFEHHAFDASLRDELLALNAAGDDELHRAALATNRIVEASAGVVAALLRHGGIDAAQVRAIGSHGQTVRHRPRAFDGVGYTLQLNNGALLAERCAIDVVCDFRSRDVVAGGEGAPLVPAFHAEAFGTTGEASAVLNLGGIANLTLIAADGAVAGFDTGPANLLLDAWAARHLGTPFDDRGMWARSGRVDPVLLAALKADPFFDRPPPKSTGRDLFNLGWLEQRLQPGDPADVQATLAELTAQTVADALRRHAPVTRRLLVCGGGAPNGYLLERLAAQLPGISVETTAAAGLAPTRVEAAAFAWLARAFVERRPGNRPEVTGAKGPRILGCLYPK
jgi:anhydro-N-acetylmuramic acid kinase